MQVVWFKRDLRVADHAPLANAAKSGQCLCLYVYESWQSKTPCAETFLSSATRTPVSESHEWLFKHVSGEALKVGG